MTVLSLTVRTEQGAVLFHFQSTWNYSYVKKLAHIELHFVAD